MSLKKDETLKEILADYESLANLVLVQLDILDGLITNAELNIPDELYKEILENEAKLDRAEVKLSDKIVNAIALYQPVANEIRQLIALYRITISLERIGDHAVSIARFMKEIKKEKAFVILSDFITNMMLLALKMVKNALLSVITRDMDLAVWTIKNETVVDELNRKLLKKAISKAQKSDEKKSILVSFIQVKEMVSNIERISDHAANIAEASIYAYEGKDIRHRRQQETEENSNPENNE